VKSFWSIHVGEDNFHRRVGRLFAGAKLMQALGFQFEANGTVLALRDPRGKEWDIVPQVYKYMYIYKYTYTYTYTYTYIYIYRL
jgi:hypothetical protein